MSTVIPKLLSELNAEFDSAQRDFLTPEAFTELELPEVFPELKKEEGKSDAKDPKTSFFIADDPVRVKYLLAWGINVPTTWYTDGETLTTNSEFHAEIVTTAILLEKFKDIFYLLKMGFTPEDVSTEFDYHTKKIFEHRVDREGDREPDITGKYKNRESRMKAHGLACNPQARVSVEELIALRSIVLFSLKKRS